MNMFRFENPNVLYTLLFLPIGFLIFLLYLRWKKKVVARFGDEELIRRLMPDRAIAFIWIKYALLSAAILFLIIALANPQFVSKLVEGERKGIDIVIALDISNSMLAEDVQPNRLERSKIAISKMIDKLANDRIGLVIFAGKAYKDIAITTDYTATKFLVQNIHTGDIATQGTAVGDAIEEAMTSFENTGAKSKAIIIMTDGENHEEGAIEAAQKAAEQGIKVYTVGIGSPDGVPIPLYDSHHNRRGYKKDRDGNTVMTKLNENFLKELADAGNGMYVRGNNISYTLEKIYDTINQLEKTTFEKRKFQDYDNKFQIYLWIALFFLILEILFFERKGKIIQKIRIFDNN
jgi:Ca-activated chloride channel family protein